MKTKAVQYFSDEYLLQCREMSTESIVEFVEGFLKLHGNVGKPTRSKLISLKVPEDLLEVFRAKAKLEGVAYQTLIKRLMRQWIGSI